MSEKRPNVFIVGAPKAGTTYLYTVLQEHPELFFPKVKELNHFSYDDLTTYGYYKDFKLQSEQKYLKQYVNAYNQKHLVDASVSYFAFASVPEKIARFNPNAKILISLRNPIKRAFSHYQMDQRMGYAPEPFNIYIHRKKEDPYFIQYIQNSLYYENIQNFLKHFKRENIHILFLERMEEEFSGVFDFLNIPQKQNKENSRDPVNVNKAPRNRIARFFQHNRKVVSTLKMVIPKSVIQRYNKYLYKTAETAEIDQQSAEFLTNLFAKDIQSLSELLDIDLFDLWQIKPNTHV